MPYKAVFCSYFFEFFEFFDGTSYRVILEELFKENMINNGSFGRNSTKKFEKTEKLWPKYNFNSHFSIENAL